MSSLAALELRTWVDAVRPDLLLVADGVAVDGGPPGWVPGAADGRTIVVTGAWTARDVQQAVTDARPRGVLAIGGGATMDAAKLVAISAADDRAMVRVRGARRCGLVLLPPATTRVPLALVPTTLGTGSEAASGACVLDDDRSRRRLVIAPALRPDVALRTADATASLPTDLLRDGLLEIVLRLVGPMVGSASRPTPAGRAAVAFLVEALDLVATGAALDGATRARAAELSAEAHDRKLHGDVGPFSHKSWYVANEMSSVLGSGKVPTTAAVLPVVWGRAAAGDVRWGHRDNLDLACRLLGVLGPDGAAPAADELPERLSQRLAAWTGPLGGPELDGVAERVARRVVRHWGAGLPMLPALAVEDVAGVVAQAQAQAQRQQRQAVGTTP